VLLESRAKHNVIRKRPLDHSGLPPFWHPARGRTQDWWRAPGA